MNKEFTKHNDRENNNRSHLVFTTNIWNNIPYDAY